MPDHETTEPLHPARDYGPLLESLYALPDAAGREVRMRAVVDAVWEAFGSRTIPHEPGRPYSWIGFYERPRRADGTDADEMILLERRDTPACSPIGLHGMCGRSCLDVRPILVADVRTLGEGYVACDPKDQSEIVIPLLRPDGSCWGVLDGDSFDLNAFTAYDVAGLLAMAEAAKLTSPGLTPAETLVL